MTKKYNKTDKDIGLSSEEILKLFKNFNFEIGDDIKEDFIGALCYQLETMDYELVSRKDDKTPLAEVGLLNVGEDTFEKVDKTVLNRLLHNMCISITDTHDEELSWQKDVLEKVLVSGRTWVWKSWDDMSGHLESPDGKEYFVYDWSTYEYKVDGGGSWDSFRDADPDRDVSFGAFKKYAESYVKKNIDKNAVFKTINLTSSEYDEDISEMPSKADVPDVIEIIKKLEVGIKNPEAYARSLFYFLDDAGLKLCMTAGDNKDSHPFILFDEVDGNSEEYTFDEIVERTEDIIKNRGFTGLNAEAYSRNVLRILNVDEKAVFEELCNFNENDDFIENNRGIIAKAVEKLVLDWDKLERPFHQKNLTSMEKHVADYILLDFQTDKIRLRFSGISPDVSFRHRDDGEPEIKMSIDGEEVGHFSLKNVPGISNGYFVFTKNSSYKIYDLSNKDETNSLLDRLREEYQKNKKGKEVSKMDYKDITEQLKKDFKDSFIILSDKMADEIVSRFEENGLSLEYKSGEWFTRDSETGNSSSIELKNIVANVSKWDDKELSELHPFTEDDAMIEKLNGILKELDFYQTALNDGGVKLNYAFTEHSSSNPDKLSKADASVYLAWKKNGPSDWGNDDELVFYEEPRWLFNDVNFALNLIRESEPELYDEIQNYIEKEGLKGKERLLYIDFGKSLRYDEDLHYGYDGSSESIDDKIDDLFIVRYSHDNDDGNVIDGGEEVLIKNKEVVRKLNDMAVSHICDNVRSYNDYKNSRLKMIKNELSTNSMSLDSDDSVKEPLFKVHDKNNFIFRLQRGQLTTELEELLDLKKIGENRVNYGFFRDYEVDRNGVVVAKSPIALWKETYKDDNYSGPSDIETFYDIGSKVRSSDLKLIEEHFERSAENWCRKNYREVFEIKPYDDSQKAYDAVARFLSDFEGCAPENIDKKHVQAFICNIGNENCYVEVNEDLRLTHIEDSEAEHHSYSDAVHILKEIDMWAEDHAAVAPSGAIQHEDYAYIQELYARTVEKQEAWNRVSGKVETFDDRLDKTGDVTEKLQACIENLTSESFDDRAFNLGMSEMELAKLLLDFVNAKDFIEYKFGRIRPSAKQFIEALDKGYDFESAINGYIFRSSGLPSEARIAGCLPTVISAVYDIPSFSLTAQASFDGVKVIPHFDYALPDNKGDLVLVDNDRNRRLLKTADYLINNQSIWDYAIKEWNRKELGTNAEFKPVSALSKPDDHTIGQIIALENAFDKETKGDIIGDDRAEVILNMVNYDFTSFKFFFDAENGNFVEVDEKNRRIVDVESPMGILSYLMGEIQYRIDNPDERYSNKYDYDSGLLESLKLFYEHNKKFGNMKKISPVQNKEEEIIKSYDDFCTIIFNSSFNTPNLKFKDELSAEDKKLLRKNGWDYSAKAGIWFPKSLDAKKNAEVFVSDFKSEYQKKLAVRDYNLRYAPNGKLSSLSKEDYIYVHSDEFLQKFGDWKRVYNLERVVNSKPLVKDDKLVVDGDDFTELLDKALAEKNIELLHLLRDKFAGAACGSYENVDTKKDGKIIFSKHKSIKEMTQNRIFSDKQVESILYVPDIIKNTIFVTESINESPEVNSEIEKYQYYILGLNIKGEDYTVKSVISIDKNGRRYYDHRLSKIEKGNLISNSDSITKRGLTDYFPNNDYDKRLLRICQVPQKKYLNENYEPTEETVRKVRNNMLYIMHDKDGFEIMNVDSYALIVEKFFAGMTAKPDLDNESLDFAGVMEWVKKEFPTKNEQDVLHEAVVRMLHDNVDFGALEPDVFDDVVMDGGADLRFEVLDTVADGIIIGKEGFEDFNSVKERIQEISQNKATEEKEKLFNEAAKLDWSGFSEDAFISLKKQIEAGEHTKNSQDFKGYIMAGCVKVDFTVRDGELQSDSYILGEGDYDRTGNDVPYDHIDGTAVGSKAILACKNYVEFQSLIKAVIVQDFSMQKDSRCLKNAIWDTIDWFDDTQTNALWALKSLNNKNTSFIAHPGDHKFEHGVLSIVFTTSSSPDAKKENYPNWALEKSLDPDFDTDNDVMKFTVEARSGETDILWENAVSGKSGLLNESSISEALKQNLIYSLNSSAASYCEQAFGAESVSEARDFLSEYNDIYSKLEKSFHDITIERINNEFSVEILFDGDILGLPDRKDSFYKFNVHVYNGKVSDIDIQCRNVYTGIVEFDMGGKYLRDKFYNFQYSDALSKGLLDYTTPYIVKYIFTEPERLFDEKGAATVYRDSVRFAAEINPVFLGLPGSDNYHYVLQAVVENGRFTDFEIDRVYKDGRVDYDAQNECSLEFQSAMLSEEFENAVLSHYKNYPEFAEYTAHIHTGTEGRIIEILIYEVNNKSDIKLDIETAESIYKAFSDNGQKLHFNGVNFYLSDNNEKDFSDEIEIQDVIKKALSYAETMKEEYKNRSKGSSMSAALNKELLKDMNSIAEELERLQKNLNPARITYSVTFPAGFTFPSDVISEAERQSYYERVLTDIRIKYGISDNEITSERFDFDKKDASFNINFSLQVPSDIQVDNAKVDNWVKEVEKYLNDNFNVFMNWQGGERDEVLIKNMSDKEKVSFILKHFDDDNFFRLVNNLSDDSSQRINILSDALSDSFETLDYTPQLWSKLLEAGADPTRAIRVAAADAFLGDNLFWLLDNVNEEKLYEIFSDNGYADDVFKIAKESVKNDIGSWEVPSQIGFNGFKAIARLCGREGEADRYYNVLLKEGLDINVEPPIAMLIETPEELLSILKESSINIDENTAAVMLKLIDYDDYRLYTADDGKIHILDVSEDIDGNGGKGGIDELILFMSDLINKADEYGIESDHERSVFKLGELEPIRELVESFNNNHEYLLFKTTAAQTAQFDTAEKSAKSNEITIFRCDNDESVKHFVKLSQPFFKINENQAAAIISIASRGNVTFGYKGIYGIWSDEQKGGFQKWTECSSGLNEIIFRAATYAAQCGNERLKDPDLQLLGEFLRENKNEPKLAAGEKIKFVLFRFDRLSEKPEKEIESEKTEMNFEDIINENAGLDPVQMAGEKFIGELQKNLPYHKNNLWVTAKIIFDELKAKNPKENELLHKFLVENKISSDKDFAGFFGKALGINFPVPEQKKNSKNLDSKKKDAGRSGR